MSKKLSYDFLNCVRKMPALIHKNKSEAYETSKSEVCNWLAQQPAIRQKMFDMAVNNKVIKYNSVTGKWQGVDYDN